MFDLRNRWTRLLHDKSTVLVVGLLIAKNFLLIFLHGECNQWYDKFVETLSWLIYLDALRTFCS